MPLTNLPAARLALSYNGFRFDPDTTETVSVRGTPHLDSARRTITYVVWSITVRSVIFATGIADDGTTNDEMDTIRRRLTSQGGALVFDRGFGEMSINTGERQKDVAWGPIPKELSWEPWGDANAGQITWQVEVAIPECNSAKFEGHAAEFCYSLEYMVQDGFVTRKISGHIEIPLTRDGQANRQLRHTADEYRERVRLPTPPGFRPLQSTWKLSEDRRRLEWSYADEEMGDDIPPPGVIRVAASMRSRNASPSQFFRHQYTLNATYDLARGTPGFVAQVHFLKFAARRQAMTQQFADQVVIRGKQKGNVFVTTWDVIEPDIFGKIKQAGFTMSWVVAFKLKGFLAHAFWTPVENTPPRRAWDLWKAKTGVLFDVRGNPQGRAADYTPDMDLVVDLCQGDVAKVGKLKNGGGLRGVLKGNKSDEPGDDGDWLAFEQSFRYEPVDSPYTHKILTEESFTSTLKSVGAGGDPNQSTLRTPNLIGDRSIFAKPDDSSIDKTTASIVGQRSPAAWYVVHTGRAIRLYNPIQCPVIVSVGGMAAIPANRPGDGFISQRVNGTGGALEVAVWRIRYQLPARPGTSGGVPNPTFPKDDENDFLHGGQWDVEFDDAGNPVTTDSLRGMRQF